MQRRGKGRLPGKWEEVVGCEYRGRGKRKGKCEGKWEVVVSGWGGRALCKGKQKKGKGYGGRALHEGKLNKVIGCSRKERGRRKGQCEGEQEVVVCGWGGSTFYVGKGNKVIGCSGKGRWRVQCAGKAEVSDIVRRR